MKAEKIAIIGISSVFFLLIVLQSNIVGFIPAVAQLEAQDGKNSLNLSGIWTRIDDYPYEERFYVTQESGTITATTSGYMGYCWEDPYNRVWGTEFAPHRLEFTGNLIDNTIQGKGGWCLPDERAFELRDLSLTVSADGRRLEGYTTGPEGQHYNLRYELVSSILPSRIEINTDRPVYDFEESVEISGQVINTVNGESDVLIEIYGSDDEQVFSDTVLMNPDGTFSASFDLNDDQINKDGTYTAVASYAGANDQITFEVGADQPPIPLDVAIATGGTIALVGGGSVLLYKQGYLKGVKHIIKQPPENVAEEHHEPQEPKSDNLPPIIELRIECGLENSKQIKRESGKGDNIITGELTGVEQKFSQALNKILENRKKIKNIQKDIEFIKWCKGAGENPNKILSKISEEVIGKFLTSIQPYFQNLLLSQIGIESDISVTKDKPKRLTKNITFKLNPIQAYIALVVYNDGVPVSSTKFIFAIHSYVKINNLTVYLEKLNRQQAQLKKQQLEQQLHHADEEIGINNNVSIGRRRIEVEGLLFGISIEFSKIKIGLIAKPIEPPIGLGKKEVEVKKNISFFSHNG